MTNFDVKLEGTFRIAYLLNKITGFLPYDDSKSAFYRRHTIGFILFTATATVLNSIWYEYPKLKIVLLLLSLLISCTSAIFRYSFSLINRNKLASLLQTIRQEFWKEAQNEEEKQIIEKYGWSAYRFHIFQVGTMLSAFPFTVQKLLTYLMKIIIPHKKEVKKYLLYRNWYSDNIDMYSEPFYEILLAIQVLGILCLVTIIPTIDSQYSYMMFSLSGQLKLLKRRIENFDKNRNEKESEQYLYKCIELHQKLTKYCEEMDSIFSYLLFFQVFQSICYLAISGYVILVFNSSSQVILQKVSACNANILQLFVFCFGAQMVTNHGDEIAEAVYNCNWVDAPKRIKSIIQIMLIRAQVPLHLHIGGFTPATIETFQQVMKTTYSIFTMMNAVVVEEKEK